MPQNVRVTEFTDTSIKYEWDTANDALEYLAYLDSASVPFSVYEAGFLFEGLEQMTSHVAQFSVFDGYTEGAKSAQIIQKTRVIKPIIDTYYYGSTYLTGTGTAGENITNCRIYKHGESVAFATGTMTGEVLKVYLTGNVNIVPNELYEVCVIDGKSGTPIIEGMRTTFKVEIPQISLNPVTTSQKLISGVTAKNIQVRISQNGTAKTIIWSDAETGVYSWSASPVVVGDVFKVETKVGNEYSTNQSTVARDPVGTLAPKSYTLGSNYVTGTFTGDVSTVALEVNSVLGTKVKVIDTSNFQYYSKDKVIAKTDQVYIIGYDPTNKQLDRKGVVIL
ncbi:hypothetical protein DUK53_15020 [Listeria sp. SHR_NRA_18]|uniref:immunoglobulin-like domain-containing protein n=1 Tax=Listeria sp. SHR_NRA_18 TaxID=2269046 RepID=UPI000F5FEDCF|nr:immunoglobulin-like domain-containing protein [Listeria sp. SHR_NRA_18]RQW65699.1 hypothetical protein DUK53_15020 [Listeria sp. SHR_NRA_18]